MWRRKCIFDFCFLLFFTKRDSNIGDSKTHVSFGLNAGGIAETDHIGKFSFACISSIALI